MDDGRLRRSMVESPPIPPQPEKPFALRAVVYTAGFLLGVLGIVPSIFYLIGGGANQEFSTRLNIQIFWSGFFHLVGIAVFTAGFIAYLICSAWLIFHGRGPHVEFDPPKVFVASGPYRWVRNPVVITLIITAMGEAIYFTSMGIALFVVLGMLFAQYQVTRIEEPRLRTRFGESYDDYCRRVHRWIPRPPRA